MEGERDKDIERHRKEKETYIERERECVFV